MEIGADENTPLRDSHEIAENVHNAIEANFPKVKHCMVHVNPVELKIDSGAAEDENLE